MAKTYNIVEIEDFADDAATIALLDAEGANDWELADITYSPQSNGSTTALCVFIK